MRASSAVSRNIRRNGLTDSVGQSSAITTTTISRARARPYDRSRQDIELVEVFVCCLPVQAGAIGRERDRLWVRRVGLSQITHACDVVAGGDEVAHDGGLDFVVRGGAGSWGDTCHGIPLTMSR